MTATVAVFVETGLNATPVPQDTTGLGPPNIRFKTADDSLIDANNPIPIPAGADNRSFWKHIFLQAISPGTFLQIDNVQFYTDGTGFGTGISVQIGNETPTKNSGSTAGYDQATGTVGTTGNELTTHANVSGKVSAFGFTSGSPKAVSISEAGAIIDAIGETTNYIVCQMDVANTASPGDLADETWTFQYDEI